MKNIYIYLIIISLFPINLFAFGVKNSDGVTIYYNRRSVKGVDVVACETGDLYRGVVNIPSTVEYNGKELSVISIADEAFRSCYELTSVTIPSTVTKIGERAFAYCSLLTSISIPEGVTIIDSYAFEGCINLTSLYIPNTVTSIGTGAFGYCVNISSFDISADNTEYTSYQGHLFNKDKTKLIRYIGGDLNYDIPDGVTSIDKYAFSGSLLTSITIPDCVTSIGSWAFSYCTNLSSVSLSKSIATINTGTFYNCISLTSINMPESVTEIGPGAFAYSGLNSITIPVNLTTIGGYAFSECKNIKEVCVKDIGSWSNIQFVDETSNPLKYGGKLSVVDCDDNGINLKIPTNINEISANMYRGCDDLVSITIHDNITNIGSCAFAYCHELTEIFSLSKLPPICSDDAFIGKDENTSQSILNDYSSITLYVPIGSKESYMQADVWSNFTNIVESNFLGIGDIDLSIHKIKVIPNEGIDVVDYFGKLQIVNISGKVEKDILVNGSTNIILPKGVYIVVANGKSQKIII